MNKISAICMSLFVIGLLTTRTLVICDEVDSFDKRASLAYFKRSGGLTDSSYSSPMFPSSSASKRATLSYFKRGHNEYWPTNSHIRTLAEICPCLNSKYLNWLESTPSMNNQPIAYDYSSEPEKRASLAYFKRNTNSLD
ncbi:unnamed protein product [Trichobilharzia szidati]|nr:unnamed protein product [Trichobilharzia szidati]